MSWQSYVDESLLSTGKVQQAAICGHDGSVWATSAGFNVKPNEVKKLVEAFSDPSGVQTGGIHINSMKYKFVKRQDKEMYGRKGSDEGCCLLKTNKAIIIAVYGPGMQAGGANAVVGALGDYLIENNY